MSPTDRSLGMGRSITRRDFINGVSSAAAGALLLPKWAAAMEQAAASAPEQAADYYPPALTGMRGDHPVRSRSRMSCATPARGSLARGTTPTRPTT